jgi:hypothetical protein
MNRRHTSKISISLLSALLLTGLVANPARADHSEHSDNTNNANNVLVPIAVGVVLGSMLYHGHGHHYQYSQHRYGHYSPDRRYSQGYHGYGRRGSGHSRYGHKSHSSSYGGYSRRSGHGGNKHRSKPKH